MEDLIVRVNQGRFVGRREEQRLFRESIRKLMQVHHGKLPEDKDIFKHIFLLHGDGGMGKTTLADRFVEICRDEGGKDLIIIKIDWVNYRNYRIESSIEMMDIIYGLLPSEFDDDMKLYKEFRELRENVRKKADDAAKEFDALASAGGAVASLVPGVGSVGKAVIEEAIKAGAKLVAAVEDRRNEWIQRKLTPHEFSLYKRSQLETSKIFVDCLSKIAEKKPIVLLFDTYEDVEHYRGWVRDGLIRHGSTRVVYVISGRQDHTAFFRDFFPEDLVYEVKLKSFFKPDIEDYLQAWNIPISDTLVEMVENISHGVPLAVKAIAEALIRRIDIQTVFGDIADIPFLNKEQVIGEVTRRFLSYCMDTEEDSPEIRQNKSKDRFRIYTLALVRQHEDIAYHEQLLKSIWDASDYGVTESQIDSILDDLTSRYSFIFGPAAEIHPTVKEFINMALRDHSIPRGATTDINNRAYDFATTKMEGMKGDPEALYRRKEYQEYCLDCLNHLLWKDSHAAVRFLAKHFVRSLGANRKFSQSLLGIISEDAREHLSDEHRGVIWALENIGNWAEGTQEQVSVAETISTMLSEWLEREDQIILHMRQANHRLRGGRKGIHGALKELEVAERLCKAPDEMGQERARTYVRVAEALSDIGRPKQAVSLLQKAIEMSSPNLQAYRLLGKLWYRTGDIENAIETYEAAQEKGVPSGPLLEDLENWRTFLKKLEKGEVSDRSAKPEIFAKSLTIKGNMLASAGHLHKAIEKYRSALSADPSYAQANIKLGHVFRQLGQFAEAQQQFGLALADSTPYIHALAYDGLGAVSRQKGNFTDAIKAYKTALALNATYSNALNGLGKAYYLQGDLEQAEEVLRFALKYNNNAYWSFNNLGIIFLLSKKENEAIESFQKAALLCQDALKRETRAYLSYFNFSIALIGKGEYLEGRLGLEKAIKICAASGFIGEVISDLELINQVKHKEEIREAISFLKEIASWSE